MPAFRLERERELMSEPYEGYDDIAENVFFPVYEEIADSMLERTGVKGGRLLDVGCGGGHMGFAVMRRAPFTGTFIDLRENAKETTLERAKEQGMEDKCSFHIMDVHALEFPDNTFDLIVSRGSMPFWENMEQAVSELYRVLAPGGKAYIGGGCGSPKLRESIEQKMKERQREPFDRMKDKDNWKSVPTEEFIRFFTALGSPYEIIENTGEGRWFIFGK